MIKKVAIVGAGQLGSRHLQGVLKSDLQLQVFVIDLNHESLKIAAERASQINHNHSVTYIDSYDELPSELDLVIVATNADVRANVVRTLLSKVLVVNMILEKVLFQSINDYDEIQMLLTKYKVSTWVNHPRRQFDFYQQIREVVKGHKHIEISVYGQNWGLACNGLHILDLISYLSDSKITSINTTGLDNEVHTSKRKGFIEVTGTLTGGTNTGAVFQVSSIHDSDNTVKPLSITINTPNQRFFVQEGAKCTVASFNNENHFHVQMNEHNMLFQSDLTKYLVDGILKEGTCSLPSYMEASSLHVLFIDSLLKFYKKQTNQKIERCPIT